MTTLNQIPCDWCGKLFLPTPDNFTESGFSAFDDLPDSADAWKGQPQPTPIETKPTDLSDDTIFV